MRATSKLVITGILLISIACSKSPTAPTSASLDASAASSMVSVSLNPALLAQCLAGSPGASCFTADRLRAAAVASEPLVSAPIFNNNQPVLNSGTTVTLSWTPTAIGFPTSYIIEASSAPGGPANLANFNTGNASTTLEVPGVPAGTYYVRVRAVDASGPGAPSNEVQLVVGGAPAPGGACPSAPRSLTASQSNGTVTLGWQPPASGAPTSYVIQAGSGPNAANLANFDTASTALAFAAAGVPPGTYFIRVYGRSSSCTAPSLLGPSSNEVTLAVGTGGGGATPSGWSGQIVCSLAISGPSGYHHNETQTWNFGGAGQTSGPRTTYPLQWSAQGSGGGVGKSWTINSSGATDFSVTVVASTGIPIFDRTTTGLIIRQGIVGTPTSFDLYEIEFPTIVASSATATSVTGTYTRATVGGDSPQQPGGSLGTLTCNWTISRR